MNRLTGQKSFDNMDIKVLDDIENFAKELYPMDCPKDYHLILHGIDYSIRSKYIQSKLVFIIQRENYYAYIQYNGKTTEKSDVWEPL